MNSILVMAHAADDKKHNIINILVVFGAYVCYFYRFNPKMYLNKIPPSVERDGMFYISRKEIELIKEILNSRDKIAINGRNFFVDSFKSSCSIFFHEDYDGDGDDDNVDLRLEKMGRHHENVWESFDSNNTLPPRKAEEKLICIRFYKENNDDVSFIVDKWKLEGTVGSTKYYTLKKKSSNIYFNTNTLLLKDQKELHVFCTNIECVRTIVNDFPGLSVGILQDHKQVFDFILKKFFNAQEIDFHPRPAYSTTFVDIRGRRVYAP